MKDNIHEHALRDTRGDTANRVGRAGEHLVCMEILRAGYECFLVEGRAGYDIIADIGNRLVRVQVKTTSGVKLCPQRKHHTPVYMFNARRMGKMQRLAYEDDQAELIAYAALDARVVAYKPARHIAQSTVFRLREYEDHYRCKTGMFMDQFPLTAALDAINASAPPVQNDMFSEAAE